MSTFDDLVFSLEDFSGTARLFPLPNAVLFPRVLLPLHVFELRYRDLLEDALDDDRLIAMGLLKPGWEAEYDDRPPLHSYACLGRVTTYHQLDDGTYNLLLLGLRRVRIVHEMEPIHSFREARVEVCEDRYPPDQVAETGCLQRKLREVFLKMLPKLPEAHEQLDQILGADVPLGVFTDVLSFMLDISPEAKQELLAEVDVHRRAETLLEHLHEAALDDRPGKCGVGPFPPTFSSN